MAILVSSEKVMSEKLIDESSKVVFGLAGAVFLEREIEIFELRLRVAIKIGIAVFIRVILLRERCIAALESFNKVSYLSGSRRLVQIYLSCFLDVVQIGNCGYVAADRALFQHLLVKLDLFGGESFLASFSKWSIDYFLL